MINALKKLIQGETTMTGQAVTSVAITASAITGTKIATNAVSGLHLSTYAIYASHLGDSTIGYQTLKYKLNTFSLAGDAVGTTSAGSVTYNIAGTGKIVGMYLTKQTSHANTPLLTKATNSIAVSLSQALVGSDLVEGVVITVESSV